MTDFLQRMFHYIQTYNISIWDVADIAIVAYVVYRILILVRRSRTAQVAKAILLLLIVLAVASWLPLRVVYFVLSNLLTMGALALIVVFQPEIRRFLEQLGSSSLGDMFSREEAPPEVEAAIAQTVQAYTSLSKDKVGALMVFERKVPLDDIIKTGTPLKSTVNAELLKNLFWNKAPLHDGAVIVRNGHIVGAGCVLPLSGNVNLSRDLGMRHRAGIGMSENSDAVVAIVSEETGSISVAENGMLKRHLAPETLERLLRNELLPQQEPTKTGGRLSSLFKSKKGDKNDGEKTHGK
ncbi:diadenylate cyclase CdaA [uncultured Intestinimonas sp.]|uniref:diadenylate cyclase CdaA n=1 Tax=uncultured Intestinimonas sp. TaxID=1689265 RepID=UPI0025D5C982|nr:diadenylate cyclase CdaA [uncultured Intestinimonas sp.]